MRCLRLQFLQVRQLQVCAPPSASGALSGAVCWYLNSTPRSHAVHLAGSMWDLQVDSLTDFIFYSFQHLCHPLLGNEDSSVNMMLANMLDIECAGFKLPGAGFISRARPPWTNAAFMPAGK